MVAMVPTILESRRLSLGALVLVTAITLAGCSLHRGAAGHGADLARPAPSIAGRYAVGGSSEHVLISSLGGDRYRIDSPGFWEGVGIFDGKTYWGVFRYPTNSHHASLANVCGLHRAELQGDRSFKVHGSFNSTGFGEFDLVWTRLP
ncbi:MAG TPA: hypothetical protein VL123_08450 [Candidatus Udaeobacter sp.]|jgi:hypothetical protein|nr:hypothetical protein [Candidatus Udaeobacter sp.]